MNTELERVEVQATVRCDHDFAIENTTARELSAQRFDKLRKISVQRFPVAALNQDFLSVAEDQCAKSIPLRLEDPGLARGNFIHPLGKHRQDWRIYWKIHVSCNIAAEH